MKRLAIIPARSGSKRLPGKNIKEFCGKPMLSYGITAALESGLFDTVMVSTDSETIAEIARKYGAEVPFLRSAEAASDTAVDYDVQREVIGEYKKRGMEFDQMAYIYPCAPFIQPKHVKAAMEKLEKTGAILVSAVTAFSFPPLRSYYIDENDRICLRFPEYYSCRSQDLQTLYHDCGMMYAYDLHRLFVEGETRQEHWARVFAESAPVIIPEEECQDIDTLSDWIVAEQKYRMLHGLV
ncbi:MAG: pseudaminic acid cytidylyltransferase [Clostridia bacterium]|nr:pseudaminic acid cytidylyltransferase [Clostridia bacterium]